MIRTASSDGILQRDVASMLKEVPARCVKQEDRLEFAHDIIVVVRERVLREIESYARQNIR